MVSTQSRSLMKFKTDIMKVIAEQILTAGEVSVLWVVLITYILRQVISQSSFTYYLAYCSLYHAQNEKRNIITLHNICFYIVFKISG